MRYFLLALALLYVGSCAPTQATSSQRVVAIGDLHGDLDATQRALRLAGAIDAQQKWIGGTLTLIQVGDQLDRGDGERDILDLLNKMTVQAQQAGGKVYVLNGNHEIMNAQGDFRYVTPKGFETFQGLPLPGFSPAQLKAIPKFAQPRAAAFLPGGYYAQQLAQRSAILIFNDTVFVHGGVLSRHVNYGLEKINQAYQSWLSGKSPTLPTLLTDEHSPIWTRVYADTQHPPDCTQLQNVLRKIGAKRMVVGHTVQPEINAACQEQVWRIDVGMSKAYGGPIQVLEMVGDQIQVLKEQERKD